MDSENNSIDDFKLLDTLFENNPELSEEEIMQLFYSQKSNRKQTTQKVKLISESIAISSEELIYLSFNKEKPEETKSSAQYEIGELYSSGGQSNVYLAHRSDGTYKKQVIFKVLKFKYSSANERDAFLAEVQILADLQHPNIVRIIDAGFNKENEPWMVLDYIQGLHIDDYCRKHQLDFTGIVQIAIELCQALAYVHKQNVLHLDIKPENILIQNLQGKPQAVLIDFGISVNDKPQKNTQNIYATPAFASPEQLIENGSVDQRSDIYAFGKLLKQLLPTQNNSDLQSIINKCCEQQATKRYQLMEALIADLIAHQKQDPVSARPLSLQQRLSKKFNKKPLLNSAIAFMLIAIVVLLTFTTVQKHQQAQQLIEQSKKSQFYWDLADTINNSTRLLYLKPVTNIQKETDELKQQFIAMEKKYNAEEEAFKRVIALAVAEVASELGYYNKSHKILLSVHDQEKDNAKISLKLAKNYLDLYQQEAQKTRQYSDPNRRKAQIQRLQRQLLQPAEILFSLQKTSTSELEKSLLFYLKGQTQQAFNQLDNINTDEIWPIPRLLIAAQLMSEEARKQQLSGQTKQAQVWYQKAYKSIEQASLIARSHPKVLKTKCQIEAELPATNLKEMRLKACDDLVAVLPQTRSAIYSASKAYINRAKNKNDSGQNPIPTLKIASNLIQQKDLFSNQAQENFLLGHINQIYGRWKRDINQSSRAEFKTAVEHFKKAAELEPQDYLIQTEYAFSLYNYANSIRPFDSEVDKIYQQASNLLRPLIKHADATILLSVNLIRILTNHGYYRYQNGLSADHQLQQASLIATEIQQQNANNNQAQFARSYVEWTYADYLVFQNKNPEPHLSHALEAFEFICKDSPHKWSLQYNYISAMLSGVTYNLETSNTQTQQIASIHNKLLNLQKIVSPDVSLSSHFGYYYNMLAKNQILSSQDPKFALRQSRKFNTECLHSPLDASGCLTQLATLFKIQYQWQFSQGKFDQSTWLKDLNTIDQELNKRPQQYQLLAQRAQLRVLGAKFLNLNKQQRQKQFQKSQIEFQTVFAKQPILKNRYQSDLLHLSEKLAQLQSSISRITHE